VVRPTPKGPLMTVARIVHRARRPFALCVWMDSRAKPHRRFFNLETLERAPDEPHGPEARMTAATRLSAYPPISLPAYQQSPPVILPSGP